MKSFIIAKKEIMDLTRDRRTMVMMFVVPFVAMPLIFSLMFNLQKNMQEKAEEKNLKVAIFGSEYAPELNNAFKNSEGITVFYDMSIDSIENYIKDEILDAAITIDRNYQSMVLNNLKTQSGLSNKQWVKSVKGLSKHGLTKVTKTEENLIIEIVN